MTGLTHPVQVSRDGGVLTLPSGGAGRATALSLRFRLFLAKATAPGTYAWPYRLTQQVM